MLILASNSPRRKELITEYITSDFLIIPSKASEEYRKSETIGENILRIAGAKGKEVFDAHPLDTVVSADTMVVFNNKVYGKPKDKKEAKRMLKIIKRLINQDIKVLIIIIQVLAIIY